MIASDHVASAFRRKLRPDEESPNSAGQCAG